MPGSDLSSAPRRRRAANPDPAAVPAPPGAPPGAPPAGDKRAAILAAAVRLVARTGLHNTPMSALAREAGVAAGTLYLYFPSKEAMLNALYLELLRDRDRALVAALGATPRGAAGPEAMWPVWRALARWYLDHRDAARVIEQCQASGILTAETRDAEQHELTAGFAAFAAAVAAGTLRDLPRQLFWALFAGPVFVLAHLHDSGEIAVTDAVLRATFDGVCRSVLPERVLPAG